MCFLPEGLMIRILHVTPWDGDLSQKDGPDGRINMTFIFQGSDMDKEAQPKLLKQCFSEIMK